MQRPNILILYTDQQRWDALGANGNPDLRTPRLDQLAAEGLNLDHCFVQSPVCMPSRASFLTGQYPSTLGVQHMAVPLPEATLTLPRLLRPYGYRCANLGKLHFRPHANRDHRVPHPDYGFDHLEIADEPGVYEDAYRAWVRREAPSQLDHLSLGLPPATDVWYRTMGLHDTVRHPEAGGRNDWLGPTAFAGDERYTHTAFVADRTIAFLEAQDARQPFLAIAGFYSPHAPWVAPQRYLDRYDPEQLSLPTFPPEVDRRRGDGFSDARLRAARQGYYAMVSEVDHHVGRILDQLAARGLAGNTVVVFTSDHGEWLGEHLKWGKGYCGEEAVQRVPLIVRWPAGLAAPGRTIEHICEAVDVLPTLLDCAGIQVPPQVQGRAFTHWLRGDAAPTRDSAVLEHTGWRTLRTASHRYVMHTDGRESLFDLRQPWGEYRDLAGDPAGAGDLAAHRHQLLCRLLEMEQPLPRTWPY